MTPDPRSLASALLSVCACVLEMQSELAKSAKAEALLLEKDILLSPSGSQNWPSLPMKGIPAWERPSRKSSVKGTLQDRTALNSWHKVPGLLPCRSAGDH